MSLRIPPPPSPDDAPGLIPGAPDPTAPEAAPLTPFAAGPGGFVVHDEPSAKSQKLSSIGLIVLVVAAAAALLFGMRQLGMGPKLDFGNVQIDYPLEGDPAAKAVDHKRVLDDLLNGGKAVRVPIEQVQTNPFEWRSLKPDDKPAAVSAEDPAARARRELEQRKKRIADAAGALVLQSVMAGRIPIARISGETVRVGDRIADEFTVRSIEKRHVDVEASDGQLFTITLGQQPPTPPR